MSELFKHPVWQNRYSRWCIIVLVFDGVVVGIAHSIFQLYVPVLQWVTSGVGVALAIVASVLMGLAYCSFKPEQE